MKKKFTAKQVAILEVAEELIAKKGFYYNLVKNQLEVVWQFVPDNSLRLKVQLHLYRPLPI